MFFLQPSQEWCWSDVLFNHMTEKSINIFSGLADSVPSSSSLCSLAEALLSSGFTTHLRLSEATWRCLVRTLMRRRLLAENVNELFHQRPSNLSHRSSLIFAWGPEKSNHLNLCENKMHKLLKKKNKVKIFSLFFIFFFSLHLLPSPFYRAAWMFVGVQPSAALCEETFRADIGPCLLSTQAHTSQLSRRQSEEKEVRAWESRDIRGSVRASLCVAGALGMRPQQDRAESSDNWSGYRLESLAFILGCVWGGCSFTPLLALF